MCFFYLYSFLIHVFYYNTSPPQFRSSYLSVSTRFHLPCSHYRISSVFLATWPNHLSLASLTLPHLPSSACLCGKVSLPCIITGQQDIAVLSIMDILLSHTTQNICRHFPHPFPTRCLTSSSQPPFSIIVERRYLNVSTCFSLSFFLSDISASTLTFSESTKAQYTLLFSELYYRLSTCIDACLSLYPQF